MTFTQYLIKSWWLVLICVASGLFFLFLPLIQRRFSPARGLSTLEATRLMNAGGVMILDVREEAEFSAGHLARAVNIPLSQLAARLPELQKKSTKNILVYCERGSRSARAAKILAQTGKAIHNLAGGFIAWKTANLPFEKSPLAKAPPVKAPKTDNKADAPGKLEKKES